MKPLVFCVMALLAVPSFGEVVHLTDGSTLEGDLRRTNDGWLVTDASGKVTVVTASQVKSIELKKGAAGDSADQKLGSLRRAVANLGDVKQIVERYKSFIAQNAGTPAGKSAEEDLTLWQDRLDKGLVKAGDQWVTREQLAELQARVLEVANQLRLLVAGGKLTEASGGVEKELAVSPQSASLLYLKSAILFRQAQLVPARNALQAAAVSLPDNAAIHNNLGVILWKQRAFMQALAEYDKAMLADPQNRTILDNVTEALHALPQEHKKSDLTKRVVAHYKDQEATLEKALAAQGQYRWGSDWLDEKEFNKIVAAQKAVQDKLDSLKKDLDDVQASLLKIAREIQDDKQLQQAIASQSVQLDPTTGRAYQLPLPQRYYDLERDVRSLQAEQVLKQRQLADLQKLQLQQANAMPTPKYSGSQKPFDVDAMPGARLAPVAGGITAGSQPVAATPPTTAPAAEATTAPPAPPPATGKPTGGIDFAPLPPGSTSSAR